MMRELRRSIDVLFVEGRDDEAVVNAFVRRRLGIELGPPLKLVKRPDSDGAASGVSSAPGDAGALRRFKNYLLDGQRGARVGLVVDRDTTDNDKWPRVADCLRERGGKCDEPSSAGAIFDIHDRDIRAGIWMWPDNVSHGALEHFVRAIIPESDVLAYAEDATRVAKSEHGAEYEDTDERKAALKVRSIWRDASTAGGYGHLVRNLDLIDSEASTAFLAWFNKLFLA